MIQFCLEGKICIREKQVHLKMSDRENNLKHQTMDKVGFHLVGLLFHALVLKVTSPADVDTSAARVARVHLSQ